MRSAKAYFPPFPARAHRCALAWFFRREGSVVFDRVYAEFLIKVLDQNQCIWIEDIVHDFYMNGKDCTRGLKFSVKRLVLQSK